MKDDGYRSVIHAGATHFIIHYCIIVMLVLSEETRACYLISCESGEREGGGHNNALSLSLSLVDGGA